MISLYRARVLFLAALVAAAVLLGTQLPMSELLHQRGQLDSLGAQISGLDARNTALKSDISALSSNANITAIAHEEYGLVRPGQVAYAILPSAGSSSGAATLAPTAIPLSDLVATDAAPSATTTAKGAAGPGFGARFLARLEFWRWAF